MFQNSCSLLSFLARVDKFHCPVTFCIYLIWNGLNEWKEQFSCWEEVMQEDKLNISDFFRMKMRHYFLILFLSCFYKACTGFHFEILLGHFFADLSEIPIIWKDFNKLCFVRPTIISPVIFSLSWIFPSYQWSFCSHWSVSL